MAAPQTIYIIVVVQKADCKSLQTMGEEALKILLNMRLYFFLFSPLRDEYHLCYTTHVFKQGRVSDMVSGPRYTGRDENRNSDL